MLAITLICKAYDFKLGSKWLTGKVNSICNRIDVNTLEQNPAPALELNEICIVEILLNQPACFDGYKDNRATGSLVFIDRLSNVTVSAGMIDCEQQPRTRFEPPNVHVTREERAPVTGRNRPPSCSSASQGQVNPPWPTAWNAACSIAAG